MTGALSPLRMMEASESGSDMHPIDRALLLLHLAMPDAGMDLAGLPLADRDRRLIELRLATFGDTLSCIANCPGCGQPLEFELEASSLLDGLGAASAPEALTFQGWEINLRPLDSRDLAAAARTGNREQAAALLVCRALDVLRRPEGDDGSDVPDAIRRAAEDRICQREAAEDIVLNLGCFACGMVWSAGFDIAEHLWTEVDSAARHLVGEVVALAKCFGWHEADILALSPVRRRAYLEALGLA
ncbi:hypothetical protein [Bradyrhizobium sp. USDA 3458]|uniref:hypothetical protein n=1 Tax=Bradyrhizobium sp. USDA 3458 TaxID=2591461 RepID=UPI001143D03B|nr:hypothetical protein [Bradyrhizobium sp. USDA 3458]